jgi:sulfide:quinone oxidoreductase
VFAIGDMVNPAINLPAAGVVAHFQAEFVANQILAELKGAYIGESFTPVAMCIMDFGDDAVLPMCDFTRILDLSGPPSCGVLGHSKAIRLTKMLFESIWFATYLS